MKIKAYRSKDRRIRTEPYESAGSKHFSVVEKMASGVLLTEFLENGEVVNQSHFKEMDPDVILNEYVKGIGELEIKDVLEYQKVKVDSQCSKCGKGRIYRELDLKRPEEIKSVPVVPFFVCDNCGSKYYSMTDSYLRRLVHGNIGLFEPAELREKDMDEKSFLSSLQEYIIRIFASKKIHRLATKG